MNDEIPQTDVEWKRRLTDEQYRVLRRRGRRHPSAVSATAPTPSV